MPLVKVPHTDAERKALIDAGVNPDDYEQEINTDDYEPIKAPPLSLTPSTPSTIPPIPASPTPLGSGLRAFGANVLPASAGVFTGTLAPLALGVVNPIAGIGATVLGGVGGYAGMKKLQDTLMPFSWEQKLERDKRENPGAVTLGNIAAQLPTMRPSIKGILDTIKGVPNLARSKATVDEVNAVRNTMLGAGMGAAGSVVGDVKPFVTGDLSAWDLTKNTARAAILGSLFNTPTALGSKLGQAATKVGQGINFKFKPTLEPAVEDPTSVMPRVEPSVNAPKETLPVIDANVTEDFHTPESKVAAEEVQAKTVKIQEDAAKISEEAARLKAENDAAIAAKEKAAQDLIVQVNSKPNSLEQGLRRMQAENRGEDLLAQAEQLQISPKTVVSQFFTDTYPNLGPEQRSFIESQIHGLSGFKPRQEIIKGTPTKSWQEIVNNIELPENISELKGGERGLISSMIDAKGNELKSANEKSTIKPIQSNVNLQGTVQSGSLQRQVEPSKTTGTISNRTGVEPKNSDAERYNLITQEMKSYDFDTPEFQRLWHEREKIKNANGGMPPVASVKPVEDEKKVEEPVVTIPEPLVESSQPLQLPAQPASVSEVPKATSVESDKIILRQELSDFTQEDNETLEGARLLKKALGTLTPENEKRLADLERRKLLSRRHEAEQFPLKLSEVDKGSDIPTPPVIPPSSGSGNGSEPPIIPPSSPIPYDKPEPAEVKKDLSKQGIFEITAPAFDQLRKRSVAASEAFHNANTDKDALVGKYVNQPLEALMAIKASESEMQSVMKKMNKIYRDKVIRNIPYPEDLSDFTPREQEILKIVQATNKAVPDEAKRRDMSINGFFTADDINPFYIQAQVDPKLRYEIEKAPDGVVARRVARQQAEYLQENFPIEFPNTEEGYSKARKMWTDYLAASNNKKSYAETDFGPLHKAQGYGLHSDIQDWNLPRVISQYGKRAALDMAVHTHLKSNPEVAGLLGMRHEGSGKSIIPSGKYDSIAGTDEVKGAWKFLTGDFDYGHPTVMALTRAINANLMGIMTGIGDIASIPMNMAPYMNKMGDLPAVIKGWMDLDDAFKRAIAVNATQRNIDIRTWGNIYREGTWLEKKLNKFSDKYRYIGTREATEQLSKILPFAGGRNMAMIRIMDYHKTKDESSRLWLEKFGRNVEGGVLNINPNDPNLNDKIEQIAKNFTDRVSKTTEGDQLPPIIMEGHAAPFMTLAKWSVANMNTVFQDIIKPIYTHGDFGPALRYMLMALGVTYPLITKFQELLTHKKLQNPTLKEVWVKGNVADKVAYLANVMGVTAAFGYLSYPIKALADLSVKNQTSFSLNNPLLDFIGTNAKLAGDIAEAYANDEDPLHILGNAIVSFAKHANQNLRLALNQTLDREKNERGDKIRDFNVFNELGDAKDNPNRNTMAKEIGLASNPLLKRDEKDFKNESDLEKAKAMIPDLIKKIDKEANGDPMRRYKLILGLMNSKDPTFPSLHTTPEQGELAKKYAKYLADVYGKEEALSRLRDAEKRELTQQAKKGELIKSFMSDTNFVSGSSKR